MPTLPAEALASPRTTNRPAFLTGYAFTALVLELALAADIPALTRLAAQRGVPVAGKDGKTVPGQKGRAVCGAR